MASKTNSNSFHYRMTHKQSNYAKKDFWQPGDALTESDKNLLKGVKAFYQTNGYPPKKDDMKDEVYELKQRFRTWKNVLIAAELPAINDASVTQKRQEIAVQKKAVEN